MKKHFSEEQIVRILRQSETAYRPHHPRRCPHRHRRTPLTLWATGREMSPTLPV